MVGLEGRENVRSTLGFLDSEGPLAATLGKVGQMSENKVNAGEDLWFVTGL